MFLSGEIGTINSSAIKLPLIIIDVRGVLLCITDIGDVEKYMCRYKHKETVNILCKQE